MRRGDRARVCTRHGQAVHRGLDLVRASFARCRSESFVLSTSSACHLPALHRDDPPSRIESKTISVLRGRASTRFWCSQPAVPSPPRAIISPTGRPNLLVAAARLGIRSIPTTFPSPLLLTLSQLLLPFPPRFFLAFKRSNFGLLSFRSGVDDQRAGDVADVCVKVVERKLTVGVRVTGR